MATRNTAARRLRRTSSIMRIVTKRGYVPTNRKKYYYVDMAKTAKLDVNLLKGVLHGQE